MVKSYMHCPSCRARMKRTGNKKVATYDINNKPIYKREYECPGCGRKWDYDEYRNIMR